MLGIPIFLDFRTGGTTFWAQQAKQSKQANKAASKTKYHQPNGKSAGTKFMPLRSRIWSGGKTEDFVWDIPIFLDFRTSGAKF